MNEDSEFFKGLLLADIFIYVPVQTGRLLHNSPPQTGEIVTVPVTTNQIQELFDNGLVTLRFQISEFFELLGVVVHLLDPRDLVRARSEHQDN